MNTDTRLVFPYEDVPSKIVTYSELDVRVADTLFIEELSELVTGIVSSIVSPGLATPFPSIEIELVLTLKFDDEEIFIFR